MTKIEITRLLQSYGSDPARWPTSQGAAPWTRERLRQVMSGLPKDDVHEIEQEIANQQVLDNALDGYHTRFDNIIEAKIMAAISHSPIDRFIRWFWPGQFGPSSAIAASILFVVGLTLGINVDYTLDENYPTWEEEIAILALEISADE